MREENLTKKFSKTGKMYAIYFNPYILIYVYIYFQLGNKHPKVLKLKCSMISVRYRNNELFFKFLAFFSVQGF